MTYCTSFLKIYIIRTCVHVHVLDIFWNSSLICNTNPDIFAVTVVTCSTFVSTLQPRSDWQSARIYCNDNYSGSILGKEVPKLLLNHVTSYEPDEYLWTNIYHGLSPWIIYKGGLFVLKKINKIKKHACFNLIKLYVRYNYCVCIRVCVVVMCVPVCVRADTISCVGRKLFFFLQKTPS